MSTTKQTVETAIDLFIQYNRQMPEQQAKRAVIAAAEEFDSIMASPEVTFESNWPPNISFTYACPECGGKVDIRKADAL